MKLVFRFSLLCYNRFVLKTVDKQQNTIITFSGKSFGLMRLFRHMKILRCELDQIRPVLLISVIGWFELIFRRKPCNVPLEEGISDVQ